jgi:hypothetical protein
MRHMRDGGAIASIGLEAERCARRTDSSTSSNARVSSSAASSTACVAATTCTECSPKRSTVESNPACDESSELRWRRTRARSMLRQMKPRGPTAIRLGRRARTEDRDQSVRLLPPPAGITPEKTLYSIIRAVEPVYNFGKRCRMGHQR